MTGQKWPRNLWDGLPGKNRGNRIGGWTCSTPGWGGEPGPCRPATAVAGSRLVVFPYLNCLLDGSLQILRNPSVSFLACAPRRVVTSHN